MARRQRKRPLRIIQKNRSPYEAVGSRGFGGGGSRTRPTQYVVVQTRKFGVNTTTCCVTNLTENRRVKNRADAAYTFAYKFGLSIYCGGFEVAGQLCKYHPPPQNVISISGNELTSKKPRRFRAGVAYTGYHHNILHHYILWY